jgi:hypothetical protein
MLVPINIGRLSIISFPKEGKEKDTISIPYAGDGFIMVLFGYFPVCNL